MNKGESNHEPLKKEVQSENGVEKQEIPIDNYTYRKEIETRERIVQIFLIIAGFFLAFSESSERKILGLIFAPYVIFTLLYYIFLTRSKSDFSINFYGLLSSYTYSLFLMLFIDFVVGNSLPVLNFIALFFLFTVLFSFALLSPNTSYKIVNKINTSIENFTDKHKKAFRWIMKIIMMVLLIIAIWISYISIKI
jgi:hypothetical protein